MNHTVTMDRAYSALEIKAVDGERRTLRGTATSPSVDRQGDVIEPSGVRFTNPLVLLWQHDHRAPIGTATFAAPTPAGIEFEAQIAKVDEPGTLKDRTDEAWQSVREKIVRGCSIGFRPLPGGMERLNGGGTRFTAVEVLELSLVSVGANQDATVHTIKAIDAELLAALDRRSPTRQAHHQAQAQSPVAALEAKRAAVATQIGIARRSGDDWGYLMHLDEGLAAEIAAEKIRATNRALGIDPDFGLTPAPSVARALESRLDALEAQAMRRVSEAIAEIDRRFDKALGTYGEALGKAVRAVLDKEMPKDVLRYCGVYSRPLDYRKGSLVTDHGAAWIALRDVEPGERPGACDAWQLAVKSGRDGRDADQLQREKGR